MAWPPITHQDIQDEIDLRRQEVHFNIADFGAVGDGASDDSAAFAAACAAANDATTSHTSGVVLIPPRTFNLGAGVTRINHGGITLRGYGKKSVLTRLNPSSSGCVVTFTGTAGTDQPVIVERVTFDGGGRSSTASTISLGCLCVERQSDTIIRDCRFFRSANVSAVRIAGHSTESRNALVESCVFRDNYSNTPGVKTVDCGVYITGNFDWARVRDCDFVGAATNAMDVAVLFVTDSTAKVTHTQVSDCRISGLTRSGLGITDEAPAMAGTFRSGIVMMTNNHIVNCKEQGIKLKNVRRVVVTGNYIEGCNTIPEEDSPSLRGAIFLNATEDGVVTGNIIKNDGTNGIRAEGLSTANGGTTGGLGRGKLTISDNVIEGSFDRQIYLSPLVYSATVSGNVITGGRNAGIAVAGASAAEPNRTLVITGNVIRGNATDGINVTNTLDVSITGNVVERSGSFGIIVSGVRDAVISNNLAMDNSQTIPGNADGIRYGTVNNVLVMGNRCGNRDGTTQRYGISVGGTNTNDRAVYNHLIGNATGTLSGTPAVNVGN